MTSIIPFSGKSKILTLACYACSNCKISKDQFVLTANESGVQSTTAKPPEILKNLFNILCRDLLITIFEKLDFEFQTNLKQSCHNYYGDLQITNFYDLSPKYQYKITDLILSSEQFQKIIKLNVSYNENISDDGIKNLTNLQELNINGNGNITDEGIKNLTNLQILNIFDNSNITDEGIKNLTNLQELYISRNKNITNKGIKNLTNLQKLNASGNEKITDKGIKNLINLRILYASDNRKITYNGIKNLPKLEKYIHDIMEEDTMY